MSKATSTSAPAEAPAPEPDAPPVDPQEATELDRLRGFRAALLGELTPSNILTGAPTIHGYETAVFRKIEAIIARLPELGKAGEYRDKKGSLVYNFIQQADVIALLRHRMAAVGLLVIPEIVERIQERPDEDRVEMVSVSVKMQMHVVCADTGVERVYAWVGEANDWGDKSTQKAGTSGDKYFLMKLFRITDVRDPDAENAVDQGEDRPRRTRQAAATTRSNGRPESSGPAHDRDVDLRRLTALAMTVGIVDVAGSFFTILDQLTEKPHELPRVPGKPKSGAPKWFPGKVMAKLKQHSKTGAQFNRMTDDEWAAGFGGTLEEVRAEHVNFCGPNCDHVFEFELSGSPAETPPAASETEPVSPSDLQDADARSQVDTTTTTTNEPEAVVGGEEQR